MDGAGKCMASVVEAAVSTPRLRERGRRALVQASLARPWTLADVLVPSENGRRLEYRAGTASESNWQALNDPMRLLAGEMQWRDSRGSWGNAILDLLPQNAEHSKVQEKSVFAQAATRRQKQMLPERTFVPNPM